MSTLKTKIWILSDFDAEERALSMTKQSFQCSSDSPTFLVFFAAFLKLQKEFVEFWGRTEFQNFLFFHVVRKHSPAEIRPEGLFGQFRRFQRKSGRFWKIWLLKNRLLNRPLYAKHSSIYLLSSFKKCTHFVLRPKLRATDWALFREKSVQKIYVH